MEKERLLRRPCFLFKLNPERAFSHHINPAFGDFVFSNESLAILEVQRFAVSPSVRLLPYDVFGAHIERHEQFDCVPHLTHLL